jgi:NAD(P)-dependent dehydrogenase (short-subunit alcohol dehydrogenase family)
MEAPIFRLDEKTAVVTGAGSGIGQSIALLFARQGAHVEILDRDLAAGEATVQEIVSAGGSGHCRACDVAVQAEVDAAFDRIASRRPRIDILVNNAAIAHIGNLLATTEEDFDRVCEVNVKGVYNCLRASVARMRAGGGGAILNLGSIVSLVGIADRFAYSMSKGAVLSMTYSVATDYIKDNIRCNCICPARVHTPFVDGFIKKNYPGQEAEVFEKLSQYQPIGRMAKPEEIAAFALYLCSDEAAFVTGCAYPIDGGVLHVT